MVNAALQSELACRLDNGTLPGVGVPDSNPVLDSTQNCPCTVGPLQLQQSETYYCDVTHQQQDETSSAAAAGSEDVPVQHGAIESKTQSHQQQCGSDARVPGTVP